MFEGRNIYFTCVFIYYSTLHVNYSLYIIIIIRNILFNAIVTCMNKFIIIIINVCIRIYGWGVSVCMCMGVCVWVCGCMYVHVLHMYYPVCTALIFASPETAFVYKLNYFSRLLSR